MEKLNLELIKLLFVRLTSIYGKKFADNYVNEKVRNVWFQDWFRGLAGFESNHIKAALEECLLNFAWPPSLAEFRKLCDQSAGVPSESQVLEMILKKDIRHPVAQICFKKIGSWRFSNMRERDLILKVKEIYGESLKLYRNDSEGHWEALQQTLNAPLTIEATQSKKLNREDLMSFKEQYKQWSDKLLTEKQNETVKLEFDNAKCCIYSNLFDQEMHSKRNLYLSNLSEKDACKLGTQDRYDRIRILRQKEANKLVNNNNVKTKLKTDDRIFSGAKHTYSYM